MKFGRSVNNSSSEKRCRAPIVEVTVQGLLLSACKLTNVYRVRDSLQTVTRAPPDLRISLRDMIWGNRKSCINHDLTIYASHTCIILLD